MILDDVGEYLEDNGIGTLATDLFLGELPDDPAAAVAVFEYAGGPPNKQAGTRTPGVQILCRASDYAAARIKIEAVYQLLGAIGDEFQDTAPGGVTINGTTYLKFDEVQDPFPLQVDQSGRQILAQNYLVTY